MAPETLVSDVVRNKPLKQRNIFGWPGTLAGGLGRSSARASDGLASPVTLPLLRDDVDEPGAVDRGERDDGPPVIGLDATPLAALDRPAPGTARCAVCPSKATAALGQLGLRRLKTVSARGFDPRRESEAATTRGACRAAARGLRPPARSRRSASRRGPAGRRTARPRDRRGPRR